MIFLSILFWLCVISLLHSYLFYPWILKFLARERSQNINVFQPGDNLPFVQVFMAVYNEDEVLQQKLNSLFTTNYPSEKLEIIIGSDHSTDRSHEIIAAFQRKHPNLKLEVFGQRTGKVNIQNQLIATYAKQGEHELLILTDANVFFEPDTIFQLAKHFKNPEIGLVGANVQNRGLENQGISHQEHTYIQRENKLKFLEGKIWSSMMGAFGACYALRANLFEPVPPDFIVDDFFLTMTVLEKEKSAIMEMEAVCHEDVSNDASQEFRRKVRISTGNFQNLKTFASLLWPPWRGLAFSFFSHKVLRWKGPVFILLAYFCSGVLGYFNGFYYWLWVIQTVLFFVPLCDYSLKQMGIHVRFLRLIAYFYYMNLALLIGMVKFLKGVKTNVWEPTKRNQS